MNAQRAAARILGWKVWDARVLAPARWLYLASIWRRGAIPQREGGTAKFVKRVFLPLFDFCLFLGGWLGAKHVVPVLNEILPDESVDSLCLAFSFGALLAFFGVAFPKLALLEFVSKMVLSAGLMGMVLSLSFVATGASGTAGGGSRWYVIPFFVIPLLVIVPRAAQLATEWGRRQAEKRYRRRLALAAGLEVANGSR